MTHYSQDEKFMRIALAQAGLALEKDWLPVGAVLVKDGRVIASGAKTGLVHPLFDHAEHNACYQALWSREGPRNLEGCTAYATLEPCIVCMSMLMTTRVSRIVYGFPDAYGGGSFILHGAAALPARFAVERPVLVEGVLAEESRRLLDQFFATRGFEKNWSDPKNALVANVIAGRR